MKFFTTYPLVLLLLVFSLSACDEHGSGDRTVSEEIRFISGEFEVHGELLTPAGTGPFGLVIMVHGDGPAYMRYFESIRETFLKAGYATFIWDKPGYGKSTGIFSEKNLQEERADILIHAIERMKNHPKIQPTSIGVWGISQAGYVIPRAIKKTTDIKFMILTGVAGENGINQTAYYIKQQLKCEGVAEAEATVAAQHFVGLFYAKTFDEYYHHAKPLVDDRRVKEMGFVTALWTEEQWVPHEQSEQAFYNPTAEVRSSNIPTLVVMGSLDKNVNPTQAIHAYELAVKERGNRNYRVELISGSDHNIIVSKSGCASERNARSRKEWANYDPYYLKLMENWLSDLNQANSP